MYMSSKNASYEAESIPIFYTIKWAQTIQLVTIYEIWVWERVCTHTLGDRMIRKYIFGRPHKANGNCSKRPTIGIEAVNGNLIQHFVPNKGGRKSTFYLSCAGHVQSFRMSIKKPNEREKSGEIRYSRIYYPHDLRQCEQPLNTISVWQGRW